jgi:hypothetical protein
MHQGLDGIGTEKHRFRETSGVEKARGEDMTALGIGAELDLIDCQKINLAIEWHRFCGAYEI